VKRTVIEHLGQLDFLHAKDSIVALGPPGLGSHCFLSIMVEQTVQGRRREPRCAGRFCVLW
jgi:hypothetical protein